MLEPIAQHSRVSHPSLGLGTVVSLTATKALVEFDRRITAYRDVRELRALVVKVEEEFEEVK